MPQTPDEPGLARREVGRYTANLAHHASPPQLMTVEEYLEFERNSPVKHEYVGGHLYAMAGVSRRHSSICGNIVAALRPQTRAGSCRLHQSDMKVPIQDGPWYYPDVVVACGLEPDDPFLEDAPCLLLEVISPNTASTDRREKLLAYRQIPSMQAYLLVEQDEQKVEVHGRADTGSWQARLVGDGEISSLCPPGAVLALADIFDTVEFERND